jgi:hypothetical protein
VFDPDFFPTPATIIERMLSAYYIPSSWSSYRPGDERPRIHSILEPSAGKGDILDWITERCWSSHGGNKRNDPKLFAIEQNVELAAILRSKGHRVIAHDFLSYAPENRFDLIVMNPPFSEGAAHLLHAWNILDAGHIVCLLNAETIRNPYTRERRLLADIIQEHGTVEDLGQCFRDAERTTDVEVVMVRLVKTRTGRAAMDFEFESPAETEGAPDFRIEETGTELMRPDQMGALIRQYEKTKEAFVDLLKARSAVAFYAQGIVSEYDVQKLMDESVRGSFGVPANEAAFENFKDGIRLAFWTHILEKLGMEKYLTSDLREKFRQFVEEQGAMALTKEHIGQVLSMILLNSKSIMDQAVVAVFDLFTMYHKENRCHVEGWVTNKSWKVNRKVILPHFIGIGWSGRWDISYRRHQEFADIDKAMCHLDGKRLEDIVSVAQALKDEWAGEDRGKCSSTFFDIRYFKKGTAHLTFRDEALWQRFNIAACQGKGWLGHES